MDSLIDIIVLYACSTFYFLADELSARSVAFLLLTLSFACFVYYFEHKYVSLAAVGLFVVFTLIFPSYMFYMPLFLYLGHNLKPYFMELGFVLLFIITYMQNEHTRIFSNNQFLSIAGLCVLSYIMLQKTEKLISLEEKSHTLMDKNSYVKQSVERLQREQRMEQEQELRLATLTERNRIAREIHDNVGHIISRSILQLGAILMINKNETLKEPLSNLKDTLNTAMNSIRESVHDLRDESLDLEPMIMNMAKDFPDLDIKLDYDMTNRASKDVKYCFLAILKEAMTNTIKHSNANTMEITIREHPSLYQLLIQDNGTVEQGRKFSEKDTYGMGLDNMRERVSALDGTITITSDKGFRIFIVIRKPS